MAGARVSACSRPSTPCGDVGGKADLSCEVMTSPPLDLAQVRLDNALLLFEEFVRHTAKQADAAALRGLERRFAERVQVQPSYWSQIKSRSRQIGERLARQFEVLCNKPRGWMDEVHEPGLDGAADLKSEDAAGSSPQDDDERFIVGLVLTYYRRHPQRARTRLLDLLGEVLLPTSEPGAGAAPAGALVSGRGVTARRDSEARADDGTDLWRRTSTGIAPLKQKR